MKREFHSIQLLRAIGALLVVYSHLTSIQENFPDRAGSLSHGWYGMTGVDLFFVLSGFIIFFVAEKREASPLVFFTRRFYRIVPIYVFFTAGVLAAMAYNPDLTFNYDRPDLAAIVKSLIIWPQDRYPLLFVGWSIEHELLFYVVIGCLLIAGRLAWAPVLLAFLFLVGLAIGTPQDAASLHLFSKYNLEFLIGIMVYRWQGRMAAWGSLLPALAGIGLLLLVLAGLIGPIGEAHQPTLARVIVLGAADGLLLASFLNAEHSLHGRILLPLIAIGDASYILYLSHPFVISIMGKIGVAIGLSAELVLPWLGASFALAVILALLFHRTVEVPFLNYARRHLIPGARRPPATAPAAAAPERTV